MKFTIDTFYQDESYGVIKFRGVKDGKFLFDRYDKSFETHGPGSGWQSTGQRVNIDQEFMHKRAGANKVVPTPPPQ